MADGLDLKISGIADFQRRAKALAPKLRAGIARKAARRAMAPVRDNARQRVRKLDDPTTRENIARNIAVQGMPKKYLRRLGENPATSAGARVGVRGGGKQGDGEGPTGDTFYWRFIELGTQHQPAQPFLRPAMTSQGQRIVDTLATEIDRELDKLTREPS